MPLYDYVCRDCGRIVEVLHGVQTSGPEQCETCGGPMRKMLSVAAVVFKGSGWAKKDARDAVTSRKPKSEAPAADAGAAPGGDGEKPGQAPAASDAVTGGASKGEAKDGGPSPAGTSRSSPRPAAHSARTGGAGPRGEQ